MADKRIQFSGVDTGVASMMQRLRQDAKSMGSDMISDARKYSQQAKEQLAFIEMQIRALEKRNKLSKEETIQRMSVGKTPAEISKISANVAANYSGREFETKLLRELIDTIKLTAKEQIAEDRKQVEQQVRAFTQNPSQFSPEDQLRLGYQRELLQPEGGKKKGIMGDVFMGTFLANALQQTLSKIASVSQSRDDEQAVNQLLGAIPVAGGLLEAIYGREREEQLQYGVATSRLFGMSGKRISTQGQFSGMGYSGTEAAGMLEGMYSAAGTSNINAKDVLGAGRAFTLDPSVLQDRLRIGRFSEGGQRGFLDQITRILKASGLEEDRVLFAELLRNQTQLVQEFAQTSEVVNQNIATSAMMMFNNVGGGFSMSDPRSLQRIQQINQALANPSSDISSAENIAILRRLNPQADIFDIFKMQEKGLQTPGFIQGVMGNITSRLGTGGYAKLALQKRLGLSFDATEQLFKNREAIMSGEMSPEAIQKLTVMSSGQVDREAASATYKLDISAAKISDAFVKGAAPGMLEIGKQVGGEIAERIKTALEMFGIIESKKPTDSLPPHMRLGAAVYEILGLPTPK